MTLSPEILYHYTSFDAFRKIMESRIIRATHYSELNDWSEVVMGAEIVERSLEAHVASIQPETLALLKARIARFRDRKPNIFIFSLSEKGDSLDQWRAYCRDGGVAIGFVAKGIEEHFRKAGKITTTNGGWAIPPWRLTQCDYYLTDISVDIQTIVSNADQLMKVWNRITPGPERNLIGQLLGASSFSLLEERCCSIKHDAYRNESEWRLFCTPGESRVLTVKLDERNRRFVEMPFLASEVIKKVVVSPQGDTRQGRTVAEHFKSSMNLSYDITESKIPFRI